MMEPSSNRLNNNKCRDSKNEVVIVIELNGYKHEKTVPYRVPKIPVDLVQVLVMSGDRDRT